MRLVGAAVRPAPLARRLGRLYGVEAIPVPGVGLLWSVKFCANGTSRGDQVPDADHGDDSG